MMNRHLQYILEGTTMGKLLASAKEASLQSYQQKRRISICSTQQNHASACCVGTKRKPYSERP